MNAVIGQPRDRVDGPLKVTGGARYAAEFTIPDLAYAALVMSTIAKGRIREIDTRAAESAPGVLAVLTHRNAPRLHAVVPVPAGYAGQSLLPLQDDRVYYQGQQIAVVVADTLERAQHAASLVRVEYDEEPPIPRLEDALDAPFPPSSIFGMPPSSRRGDPGQGLAAADVRLDQTYTTPTEHHNPMEPSATIAAWDGDHLTIHDATQSISFTQQIIATMLEMPAENLRVVAPYVGGGFGCKGTVWPHPALAALAARQVGRPVKLVLTRAQMYTSVGYRSPTRQQYSVGATREGKLTALVHHGISQTPAFDEYAEFTGSPSRMLYACPNVETRNDMVRVNAGTPTIMRAPGEAPGSFGLESAMDELAYALGLDPLELRLRNYAERDPETGHPWSSKALRECYRRAAERFGWDRRTAAPRSMRAGDRLVGWGMATASYPLFLFPASALVRLLPDGRALVQTGSQDLGTGTYTVMTQVAADTLGLPFERVRVDLGDSSLPPAPTSGGSDTAASVGSAVYLAARAVRDEVARRAIADPDSPLHGSAPEQVVVEDGRLFVAGNPARAETYVALLERQGGAPVEARHDCTDIVIGGHGPRFGMHAYGAHFAEVHVDPLSGEVRVARWVGAFDIGRVLNAKTARSQLMGGIIFGVGMALMEHTVVDPRLGRILTPNLSGYLVPVHADVPDLDVQFVDQPDEHANPLGVKGAGELGVVGAAAAVANAVYHATGVRVRDLPITPDKLL
jgi:xanthine dehydrogenase YagR molybdenum-binding subunit